MKSPASRCSMSECVVGFLLTIEADLLKLAKPFAKLLQQAVHMFARQGLIMTALALPFSKTRAQCSPGAAFFSQFSLGCLFHSSFFSVIGLLAWKPYVVPQICLKACAGWEGSLPRMRRKMLCRTHSRLQMMGFPVGVV